MQTAHLSTQKLPIRKGYFLDKNSILKKYLEDNEQIFYQYIVPAAMIHVIMTTVHDNSGHSGFRHMCGAEKRHYFWRGMKKKTY